MRKIIWTCWFQGRENAPELVQKCLKSWVDHNPDWDFRCLDAKSVSLYVDLADHIDLAQQCLTPASLSDVLRLLLLREFGGVWVDATTFCNAALDEWLPSAAHTGFFAFSKPAEGRPLASWLLYAEPGNSLLEKWAAKALRYWRDRASTKDYFWVHHQFVELCSADREAFRAWQSVPRISADGPHCLQHIGLYSNFDEAAAKIDWTIPLFKLTYRLDEQQLTEGALVAKLLGLSGELPRPPVRDTVAKRTVDPVGLLKVNTENLGDHIQIIAAEELLRRGGFAPSFLVDRDDEIAQVPPVPTGSNPGVVLNGWFKTNPAEWPPHPAYRPIYLGFHIRLFQAPSLIGAEALEHYRIHGPIGCRDRYTLSLLRSYGVDAFLSHCLTITFPRRSVDPEHQTETFVVSRDTRILDYIPGDIGPYSFISHYSGSFDFEQNKASAAALLDLYRDKAKLIVTTLLHCALPALAMGIPVVVFYPPNGEAPHKSDIERFSSLSELVRVFRPVEASQVDWRGYSADLSALKLQLIDRFFEAVARWGSLEPLRLEGIAPAKELPVPTTPEVPDDPERLVRLAETKSPDRQRWGTRSSYNPEPSECERRAVEFIRDGSRVFEIGMGAGRFRDLVTHRCHYVGADLEPLEASALVLDLESDAMPGIVWDTIVLLSVLEYVHDPVGAIAKVAGATRQLVLSYCLHTEGENVARRRERGWVSDLTVHDLMATMTVAGFHLSGRRFINQSIDFEQIVFNFEK